MGKHILKRKKENEKGGVMREILNKINKAEKHVFDLCNGKAKWTMRVPINEKKDSDCIIISALMAAKKLLEKENSKWKATKDELPEYNKKVLVVSRGRRFCAFLQSIPTHGGKDAPKKDHWWYASPGRGHDLSDVTAWCELPGKLIE